MKVVQYVLDHILPATWAGSDRLRWRLERLDHRASRRAYGALQPNAVFRRAKEGVAA